MNTELIITVIIYLTGGAMNICLAILVIYTTRKKLQSPGILFALMTLSISVFEISLALGISAPSVGAAQKLLGINAIDILMGVFIVHWFYAVLGENKKRGGKITLGIFYGVGILLLAIYAIFPSSLLQTPVPKLYLNFYYNPGPLYITMLLYFMVAVLFGLVKMFIAYRKTDDMIQKNRYKYVFAGLAFGYIIGPTAFLLVYNIPFNPLWSGFFGLYTLPLAYAMVRYELLDIRILAKRALLYGVTIGFVGVLIAGINILNNYATKQYPFFPQWIGYTIVSIIVGGLGVFVWSKIREADLLKYEFVTIITHKFRTPLTRIKWSAEGALDIENIPHEAAALLKAIRAADAELIELTGILTTLNDSDSAGQFYHFKKYNAAETVDVLIKETAGDYSEKNVKLTTDISHGEFVINADPEKIKFALEILFRNALVYTPKGGNVIVRLLKIEHKIVFTISDDGIGISKPSMGHLFTKFYRAANARDASTEGTGIGLYMAKKIIERCNGFISAQSDGEGKGSEFTVSFPEAQ